MSAGDTSRSTSRRVIEAVADETGTDPTELEALYRTVDPDCLDALFRDRPSGGGGGLRVEFRFGGCRVVVSSDDTVSVSSADEDAAASYPSSQAGGSSRTTEPPD